jgi:hypothetical protein
MSFYMFRLERIHAITIRGRIPDNDIITFSVIVNQVERGRGAALFPDVGAGASFRPFPVLPRNGRNIDSEWNIGPFEIAPGDLVAVAYTGTNTSDDHNITLDTALQDKIEIKILDTILTSAVGGLGSVAGGVGAALGSVIGGILGVIGDPVGTILGFQPQGPCNGVVFAGARDFTGAGLDATPMNPLPGLGDSETLPGISLTSDVLTDTATHDTAKCGHPAETTVTIKIFRLPFVSVRSLVGSRFPEALGKGLRQVGSPGNPSLKSRLGITL